MTKQRIKHSFKALLKYFYIDIFRASYTHPSLWSRLGSLCGRAPRGTHTPQSHSPAAFSSPGTLGALHSDPFHGCIPPGRGPAGTRKGGAAPTRAEAPPQPHGHRRQEAEGRSSGQQRGNTGRNQDQGAG